MPVTADLDSILFRHLTNRAKPALVHPTNSAFNRADWNTVVLSIGWDNLKDRDLMLIQTAVLIGTQTAVLRQNYTSQLFAGFTSDQVAVLAVANANRGFLLIKEKALAAVDKATEEAGRKGRKLELGAASQIMIQTAEGMPPATPDDIHNSLIDTLPHWFTPPTRSSRGMRPPAENLGGVAQRAGAILSLEHSFRTVWQEALWEPWKIAKIPETGHVMVSADPEWQIGWRAWDLRQQALSLQGAIMNRQFERIISNSCPRPALPLTVTGIDLAANPPVLTVAPPSDEQATSHRMQLDVVDDAYTRLFMDQELEPGVTPTLLSHAVLVLQDLAALALPSDFDPENPDWPTMERLACALPRETVVDALARSLKVVAETATSCVRLLTSDSGSDLAEMFRIGVWHRPLIAAPSGMRVLIVAGALLWGSPIRRTERWLQAKNGVDLSKTPNGLLYEANVRDLVRTALSQNPLISPQDRASNHLPKGKGKEEIDLLVRIGSQVIVGEIKCLLAPSEPSERYNYLRKLENACKQAQRKAKWLESEQVLAQQLLGGVTSLKMMPLVIVNQSNGVGLQFDGCQVTDTQFLRIVLGGGTYHSGAKFDDESSIELDQVMLYSSFKEAEAILSSVFINHLGIQRYRDAAEWRFSNIPLAGNGGELRISYPVINEEKYWTTGPFASEGKVAPAKEVFGKK